VRERGHGGERGVNSDDRPNGASPPGSEQPGSLPASPGWGRPVASPRRRAGSAGWAATPPAPRSPSCPCSRSRSCHRPRRRQRRRHRHGGRRRAGPQSDSPFPRCASPSAQPAHHGATPTAPRLQTRVRAGRQSPPESRGPARAVAPAGWVRRDPRRRRGHGRRGAPPPDATPPLGGVRARGAGRGGAPSAPRPLLRLHRRRMGPDPPAGGEGWLTRSRPASPVGPSRRLPAPTQPAAGRSAWGEVDRAPRGGARSLPL
jgi:hypothetical protein